MLPLPLGGCRADFSLVAALTVLLAQPFLLGSLLPSRLSWEVQALTMSLGPKPCEVLALSSVGSPLRKVLLGPHREDQVEARPQ